MEIAIGAVTTAGIGYLGYSYLRNNLKVDVNCWFCNEDTYVEWRNQNNFVCPHCEQFNGFTESGDYTKKVTSNNSNLHKRYCMPTSLVPDVVPSDNGLCSICNAKQAIIVEKLANFEPSCESKFNEEYETYKYKLDQMYALCGTCSLKTHQKLQMDKETYRYLLDLKYMLFPIIKNSLRYAGKMTTNLLKRRRRHFFAGGTKTVTCQFLTFIFSLLIFVMHFNFLQEDTEVVFVPTPLFIREFLVFALKWSLSMSLIALLAHSVAMKTNQSRANFPDLIQPILLIFYAASYLFYENTHHEDLVLLRCALSALCSVMSFIVFIVPRKRLHKTKPNRVFTSAFSVASTPTSQCSSQNTTLFSDRLHTLQTSFSPRGESVETPKLTKQIVQERWRERVSTPEPTSHKRRFFIENERSPEEMDWEPSIAPSVVSLSSFNRQTREVTPSRHLASTLSGLTLKETKRRSNALSDTHSMASGFTSVSRMRPLIQQENSPKSESNFTSISQQTTTSKSNEFIIIAIVLLISLVVNCAAFYYLFRK